MDNNKIQLRKCVENRFGIRPRLPRDFEKLRERLAHKLGESVSATTLRRLWGINNEGVNPSKYTLNVLSRFVGYADYDDFVAKASLHEDIQAKKVVVGDSVETSRLAQGERLVVEWESGRKIVVEFLGHGRFRVLRAENTCLRVGDTFLCQMFINGGTTLLSDVESDGNSLGSCQIGSQGGVKVDYDAE